MDSRSTGWRNRTALAASLILALGLVAAGFLAGGRYEIVGGDANTVVRLDRFTGQVTMCIVGSGLNSCGWEVQPASSDDLPPCPPAKQNCKPWERAWSSAQPAP